MKVSSPPNMRGYRTWMLALGVVALSLAGWQLLSEGMAASAVQNSPEILSEANKATATTGGSWSSGWVTVALGTCQTFSHNLGGNPDDYAVELWFVDTAENQDFHMGMNRWNYGGLEVSGYWRGVHWEHLQSNTIDICRGANDIAADQVRIRVWDPPGNSDYDSGWTDIGKGPQNSLIFTHGLGIAATELTVSLWFSGTANGIHHYGYGGLADDKAQKLHGAYWHRLTDNTVQVTRWHDDEYVEQVRVQVVHGDPPDYDSLVDRGGWQDVGVLFPVTFTHSLNWDPSLLVVRAECNAPGLGINQMYAGGQKDWFLGWQGAYIRNLTASTVAVQRGINDDSGGACPQVRVRIWRRGAQVYLPFVVRDF